mgnify:CR=1 FL=1
MTASWYVIHTKPRQEFRASEQLQNQGYEVFLPSIGAEHLKAGQVQHRIEPLFPRYLFIRLNQVDQNWGPIRSTKGVSQLVRFGGVPASLDDEQIEAISYWANRAPEKTLFQENQVVSIVEGPFVGMEGFFQRLETVETGEERALVLMELFGKTQRVMMRIETLKAGHAFASPKEVNALPA